MMICNEKMSFKGGTQRLTTQSTIAAELVAGTLEID